jgi:hypothetical protein
MDRCSQWYIEKRSRLLVLWVVANSLLTAVAFSMRLRFGIAWMVVATLGFIVGEKLLLRTNLHRDRTSGEIRSVLR